MGEMPICILKDCVESFSDNGPLTPVPGDVDSVAELVGHLRAAVAGSPRQFNMELPGDVRVVLWLGGPWAAIQWCHLHFGRLPPPGHPPMWRARAEYPADIEYVPFLLSTREVDIQAEWLLPADEVIRMATYIAEHRTLPAWGAWVDNEGTRYAGGAWAGGARCGQGPDCEDGAIPF
jgi:hypothetical protein